jgi:hypothetical protein
MNSIKNILLAPRNKAKIIKITLTQVIVALVLAMSPDPSYNGIIEEAEAAGLTSVSVVPASNIINERATYDIFLKTATSGTIKTIQMDFPSGFNLAAATKYIERGGIGSGSLSVTGTTLKYTVSSPVSVPAGTNIRLEIARIIATAAGSFTVSIKTLNTGGGTIDGPTTSSSFIIKTIAGNDISPSFMLRKTLKDDAAGHAHGWDPNGATTALVVSDSDIDIQNAADLDKTFISILVYLSGQTVCGVNFITDGAFTINCSQGIFDGAELHYVITKLPPHLITSSASATQFALSQDLESLRAQDQIASEFP